MIGLGDGLRADLVGKPDEGDSRPPNPVATFDSEISSLTLVRASRMRLFSFFRSILSIRKNIEMKARSPKVTVSSLDLCLVIRCTRTRVQERTRL